MGDLGDFDFGGIGGIAPGTGMLAPENLPGIPDFTIPDLPAFGGGAGIMGGVNIPDLPTAQLPAGTGMMPMPNYDFTQQQPAALNPGAGVTLSPAGAPSAGGGDYDLSKILGQVQGPLKLATGAGGLAVQGLGIKNAFDMAANARDQSKIQRGFQQNQQQLQQQQQKSVAPLQQFGTNQLQQAAAGQVDPAIQAYIDQWAQGQKVKMAQQFAKMGLTNSPMYQSALGQIDQQALTMRSSVIGQDKAQAIAALQAAMGGTGTAMQGAHAGAMVANQEQNQLDNLIKSSQAALAQLNAMAS